MKRVIQRPAAILRAHRRTYAMVSGAIYGALGLSMLLGVLFPPVAQAGLDAISSFASLSPLGATVASVHDLSFLALAGLILVSTIGFGALGMASLPSAVIPYSGVVLHVVFAAGLGLSYAPQDSEGWVIFWAHLPTLILELQGYIIVLLGSVLLARYSVRPRKHGFLTRSAAYRRGIIETAWLYIPAIVVLIAGAVYEALEVLVILG